MSYIKPMTRSITINDTSGGMNQHSSPELINNNQSPISIDCAFDQDGSCAHRLGSDLINATVAGSGHILGLGVYNKSDNTSTQFVVENGNLDYDNAGTYTAATGGGSLFGSTNTVEFDNFLDRLYFVGSGSTEYLKYVTSGTSGVTTVSGNIQGKYLAVSNGRIFVGGGVTNPRRLYWSTVGSDTFNTSTDFFDLDSSLTGVVALGEQSPILAFDAEKCYVIDPISKYIRPIAKSGCSSHRSIKVAYGNAVWLGRYGLLRMAAADSIPTKVSTPIENGLTFDAVFNSITSTGFANAAAIVQGNKYYLAIGDLSGTVKGRTLNDCWIVYDVAQKSISCRTYTTNGAGVVFALWINGSGNEVILSGSRDTKTIYQIDKPGIYTDDDSTGVATDVTAYYTSKHFDLLEIRNVLTKTHLKIYAANALALKYAIEGATTYSTWATTSTTTAGLSWHREEVVPFENPGIKTLSIELSGTGQWVLYRYRFDLLMTFDSGLQSI